MHTDTHTQHSSKGSLNPNTKLKSLVGEGWGSIIHTDGGRYVSIRTEKKGGNIQTNKQARLNCYIHSNFHSNLFTNKVQYIQCAEMVQYIQSCAGT